MKVLILVSLCLLFVGPLAASIASSDLENVVNVAHRNVLADEKEEKDEDTPIIKKKTPSNIIESAGSVNLLNGNGDLDSEGRCQSDVKAFCKDVSFGEGRVLACLVKRIRAQNSGNVVGTKVKKKCINEISDFRGERSVNINHDVPLARACKDDAAKMCPKASDINSPGSTLACLRDSKSKLGNACKNEVFRTQLEATEDYKSDYMLFTACKDDVLNLCEDEEDSADNEIECLNSKRIQVSWECQTQMFRNEKESGEDIRLSTRLFSKCVTDFKKFCTDVEPGHMQVQECLEDHMDDDKFSSDCKEELESTIAKRVGDFKLDIALRESCEDDLADVCGSTLTEMDNDDSVRETALNCLQQYKEELKTDKCKAEVHRRMSRAGRDFRFDEALANACQEDRSKYCSDVQAGSARVIRCLQENRNSIVPRCAAALFDHEVRMAEDIDFKYPMKRACAWEINSFCKDIPNGHARVIRCLEEKIDDVDMSKECKIEVVRDTNRMAQDYRLNWRLDKACEADIPRICPNLCSTNPGQSCGGLVLHCLTENQDNVTSQACQDEIFYYELMEVTDFRNDVILAEACRGDVESLCLDVEPGEGRVHQCLRMHRDELSPKCKQEEMKLAAIEYRDIRLRPKLNKLCSEEKAVYCKDTKPGKARVVKCLLENMAEPNFGEDCKEELQKREDAMKSDYRFDVGVYTSCASDVDQMCQEEKTQLRGNATVLKCLVNNFKSLTDQCQTEMSRAVRLALWDFTTGAFLTQVCDNDVDALCPKNSRAKAGAPFTIGVVGRCLSKSLVQGKYLQPKCRELVLVAAPKDARGYFENPGTTNALVSKLDALQRGAGLDGTLIDPYQSAITVTGWVALACIMSIIVVIVGGATMVYQRITTAEKPHTLHVKMGDA